MKIALIVLSVIDVLMLASTLICGFWIRSQQGLNPDPSSLSFHAGLAVASTVLVLITLILAIIRS